MSILNYWPDTRHTSYWSPSPPPVVVYCFQAGALFAQRTRNFGMFFPIWAILLWFYALIGALLEGKIHKSGMIRGFITHYNFHCLCNECVMRGKPCNRRNQNSAAVVKIENICLLTYYYVESEAISEKLILVQLARPFDSDVQKLCGIKES